MVSGFREKLSLSVSSKRSAWFSLVTVRDVWEKIFNIRSLTEATISQPCSGTDGLRCAPRSMPADNSFCSGLKLISRTEEEWTPTVICREQWLYCTRCLFHLWRTNTGNVFWVTSPRGTEDWIKLYISALWNLQTNQFYLHRSGDLNDELITRPPENFRTCWGVHLVV